MIDIQILQNIGLTKVESLIYISLLEHWSQSVSGTASISGCNRVQVYTALKRLKQVHLIWETIRGKRKFFFAENPENLENIFQEQKSSFENTISFLQEKYQKKQSKPELKTYYTEQDISKIYQDVVDTLPIWGIYYRYSSRTSDYKRWTIYNSYKAKRDAKDIQRMVITSDELKKLKEDSKKSFSREMRAIPKDFDLFTDNVTKLIYANKVAILDHNTKTSFIIENQKFADFEKKIFTLLFSYLRK